MKNPKYWFALGICLLLTSCGFLAGVAADPAVKELIDVGIRTGIDSLIRDGDLANLIKPIAKEVADNALKQAETGTWDPNKLAAPSAITTAGLVFLHWYRNAKRKDRGEVTGNTRVATP